jgi:hypothetical protein
VPINLPDSQKEEALALRNKLLTYRLRTRPGIQLDPTLREPHLEPRMNQILLPLLSVAPERLRISLINQGRALQAGIIADRSVTSEGLLIATVSKCMRGTQRVVSVGEITTAFASEYGRDYERPITNRWIGALLRRLGITLYKSNGVTVLVPGQEARIAALCARYGIAQVRREQGDQGDGELGTAAAEEIAF